MKKLLALIVVVTSVTSFFSFILPEDPWKVPEKYENLKNPVKSDAVSIKAGKEIYNKHCITCHGISGKGDGKRAANLNNSPADFTSAAFQTQTDGALLYKIYLGHKDMPSFKKRIPDNDDVIDGSFGQTRTPGDLVNYLRTFSK
jgi:mono/diheme cytochrome c family protein